MKSATANHEAAWVMRPFPECLDELRIRKPGKLLARDYKPTGTVPVVDQGQKFIAGWTSDEAVAIRENLPFIVFGDHTRAFKFVNFPFALGADGTQLLKPRPEFNPRFFYYGCLQLSLPNRGYNRHFTLLKEQSLPVPPKPEQEKIAAVLWKVQRAIQVEEKLTATARELKQSAMRQLFTCGLRNESQKETDSGLIPESWEMQPISANAKLVAGGTPSRGVKEFWTGGTIPWVKTGEVDYCVITESEEKITPVGLENSAAKILPKGTLLIAMYGQGITRGKVAILGIDAATNQASAGIIPMTDKLMPMFLYYFLSFSYDRLRSFSHGAQQLNLNAELVGSFHVPLADPAEQKEIVSILQTIDRKISVHERKRAALSDLFQTMLHELMTAKIRVDKLDIDTAEINLL